MQAITNESDFNIDSGLVAVKFWATWCAPCKRMDPVIRKMESEFDNIKFISIDIDQVSSIAQKYRIRTVPSLLLFKNGLEVNRINGLVLTSPLRKAFRDLARDED